MRKVIIVAALVLLSTAAQASPSRGLTLVSVQSAQPVQSAEPAVQQPASAPTAAPVTTSAASSQFTTAAVPSQPTNTAAPTQPTTVSKATDVQQSAGPKHRHASSNASTIISELHRHGIYW